MAMGRVEKGTRAKLRKRNMLDDDDGNVMVLLVVARGLDMAEASDDFTGVASLVREYRQLSETIYATSDESDKDKLDKVLDGMSKARKK